jgi:hypothetical protein
MHHSDRQFYQTNTDMTDVESTFKAMSMQEENAYLIDDYFLDVPTRWSNWLSAVDADAREQIAVWFLRIVQALDCSIHIAEISLSCLDRFVSSENGRMILLDRSQYQLAALTALYSCVKTHNESALTLEIAAKLSRNDFSKSDIEAMERRMLDAIRWRVNPPTASDFVRIYLDMSRVWNWLDMSTREMVLELVEYQINLSIMKYEISLSKASHIAIASLLNATKSICPEETGNLHESLCEVAFACDIDEESLESLQEKLYEAMLGENSVKIKAHNESVCGRSVKTKADSSTAPESPRTVYDFTKAVIV